MSPPLLTISIPSYNREGMVLELLAELDQPGWLPFPFEVVVSNNASTTSDYAAVAAYEPRHFGFRYVRLPRLIGAFENVIGNLRRATGQFCVHVGDDDRLVPDALADAVATMQAQPEILATYCTWEFLDLSTGQIMTRPTPPADTVFTLATAAGPLRDMVRLNFLSEIGVYRTAALHATMLPAVLHYVHAMRLFRQLHAGAIRFTGRSFYRYVASRSDEPFPRPTFGTTMAFEVWEAIRRSLGLWSRLLPADGPARAPTIFDESDRTFRELSFNAAVQAHRHLEAFHVALDLATDPDYRIHTSEAALGAVCTGAAIESLHQVLASMPELDGIAVDGFEPPAVRELGERMAQLGGNRPSPVVPAAQLPGAALARHLVLTMRDFQRAAYLVRGCPPGTVYSLESLLRAFSAAWLPPPRVG